MDLSIYHTTKVTKNKIHELVVNGNSRYCRSIYLTDEKGNRVEIVLFADNANQLIIKNEE